MQAEGEWQYADLDTSANLLPVASASIHELAANSRILQFVSIYCEKLRGAGGEGGGEGGEVGVGDLAYADAC